MKDRPIIMIGAGGHAKVLLDILCNQHADVIGIVDNNLAKQGQDILGVRVLGNDSYIDKFSVNDIYLVNGIGSIESMSLRTSIYNKFKKLGYSFKSIMHDSAVISSSVKLGEGAQVMAGVIINIDTCIGRNTIINTKSSIDHDCFIGNHVHIAPGSTLSGSIIVGDCTHIGSGCTIIQGCHIGKYVLIGAGSLVINNIADNVKVFGVPTKEV